jgi:hypothetical protein
MFFYNEIKLFTQQRTAERMISFFPNIDGTIYAAALLVVLLIHFIASGLLRRIAVMLERGQNIE